MSKASTMLSDQFHAGINDQLAEVLERLAQRQRFSYVKINHGLWERLLATEHTSGWGEQALSEAEQGDYFLSGGFRSEIIDILQRGVSQRENFIFAASIRGFPNASRLTGWPTGTDEVIRYALDLLPDNLEIWDGLMWKWAALNGQLQEFGTLLKERHICLVGPAHLHSVKPYFQLSNFHHISIPLLSARKHRREILDKVLTWAHNAEDDAIILFQAGSLSTWLISHLDQQQCPSTLIDLGRILDLGSPTVIEKQDWGILLCNQLNSASANLTHVEPLRDWDRELVEQCKIHNDLFEPPIAQNYSTQKIDFLENKPQYNRIVETLLTTSNAENHWANYGPVTQQLERVISKVLNLTPHKKVVACSSGTSAIEGLVALEEELAGRPLRWVVPAYTFPSSLSACQGRAQVIDVAPNGQFSMSQLKALPLDSYDAVLATNLFGRMLHIEKIAEFCSANSKALVLDNATGFHPKLYRSPSFPNEAISFHHTKVWGMGEGGCIICKPEHEHLYRALLSPGLQAPVSPERRRNAKLDDFSSARILARLLYHPRWTRGYSWQAWRIEEAAASVGYQTFGSRFANIHEAIPTSFTALIAPTPVTVETLASNKIVSLGKYYRPLSHKPIADNLFTRAIAVPNHPQMASLSRSDLQQLLSGLIGGN